jgi:hypothetical protein
VAVVEHTWVEQVKQALAQAEADLLTASISADISEQLDAGHEVAYTAISSEHGFSAARVAGGEDMVEAGQITWMTAGCMVSVLSPPKTALQWSRWKLMKMASPWLAWQRQPKLPKKNPARKHPSGRMN